MSTKKPKKSSTFGRERSYIIPLTTMGIISLLVVVSLFRSTKKNTPPTPSLSLNIEQESNLIDLPHPNKDSRISVERALNNRRSYRSYQDKPLSLNNLSQLLWSAQGVTANWGGRTVYSAKSDYPLSLYVAANQVSGLDSGLYLYTPGDIQPAHQLISVYKADIADTIKEITDQYSLQHAPLILIITSRTNKIESYLEAGHAAQNLFLQSESLGLGMAVTTTFNQDLFKETLKLPTDQTIIYLTPIGHPKK